MKISRVVAPRTSAVTEVADPRPAADQVLVEVLASGVCTSDLPPWRTGPAGRDGRPVWLGHEIAGRVVTCGAAAGQWQPGDVVTGLGDHGFASMAVLTATHVLPVPAGIEPALALGEPVADLAEAMSRTPLAAGSRVAVVGLGFMGLGLVQLARENAPGVLIGVDPVPAARQRALDLGADLVFAPDEIPAGYRGDFPAGRGGRAQDARADVVLEATGVTPGLTTAGALVRPYGTLCVVGYHHAGDALMDMSLWYKGATIVNGFCPDRSRLMAAMSDALDLIARRRFSYAPLITHRFGLDQVDEAYTLMDSRADGFVKAVLIP